VREQPSNRPAKSPVIQRPGCQPGCKTQRGHWSPCRT
jgi:hypothetical protein